MLNSHLFSGIAQFTDKKPISDQFLSVCRAGPPFFASSLCHDLFIQTFSQFPYQKFMVLCMKYISWLGSYIEQMSNAMTANVKCIVTWLYVGKKRKNIFMASFYGWGSTASRLKPLRGGSLLFTTKLSSYKFLVLVLSTSEGCKTELTLDPPSGFEHRNPGLGIQRLDH